MRWLLLDEIVEIQKGLAAKTRSRTPSSFFGPHVFLVEMMAQTAGLLLGAEDDYRSDVVFAKIESVQFAGEIPEKQPLWIEAVADNLRSEGAWFDTRAVNDCDVFASARLLLMNVGSLGDGAGTSMTFHTAFMRYFDVRNKITLPPGVSS